MTFRYPLLAVSLLFTGLATAQDVQDVQEDKRIFGVIPNNRTTEASLPFQAISARRKMTIALKDSFAWPLYATTDSRLPVGKGWRTHPSWRTKAKRTNPSAR